MNAKQLPYHLYLLGLLPFVLVISILGMNQFFDLQIFDTYIVFQLLSIGIAFGLILAVQGMVYWWLRYRKFRHRFTLLQIGTTIVPIISLIAVVLLTSMVSTYGNMLLFLFILLMLKTLLMSQFLFIINVVLTFQLK